MAFDLQQWKDTIQQRVVSPMSVAAPFCSGRIARSAAHPSDLAIQGKQSQHR